MFLLFKRKRLIPFEYKGFRLVPTENSVYVFTLIPNPRTTYRDTLRTIEQAKQEIDEGKIKQ